MARLDGGRFNRWVEKFFNIKQAGASITGVEDSIRPVAPLFLGNEDRYIQGWNRFMFTATQAAVAAANSSIAIRNPAGSGIIGVLEKVNVLAGASALCQVFLNPGGGDLTTAIPFTTVRLDPRGLPRSVMSASSGSGPAPPAQGTLPSFRMISPTTSNTEFIATVNQEITILPGDQVIAICELVNTQVSVAFMWRERVLESSELN